MVAVGAAREPVTFVRLEMRRMASKREPERARPAILGCAIRQSGLDHRAPALSPKPPNAAARYEFAEGCAVVDGAAVCLLPTPAPAKRYAVLGAPYAGAFTADQVGLKPPTAALIATWELGSGAELSLDLKLPWTPIPLQSADRLGALRSADYDYYMKALAEEWIAKLATGMDLSFPEEKPLSAYAANVVYALLAIETGPGGATRPVHRLGTAPLSGTESAAIVRALDVAGQAAWARE